MQQHQHTLWFDVTDDSFKENLLQFPLKTHISVITAEFLSDAVTSQTAVQTLLLAALSDLSDPDIGNEVLLN
jgi:hypothetical protein